MESGELERSNGQCSACQIRAVFSVQHNSGGLGPVGDVSGGSDTIAVHGSVTTVPAGRLLHRPANFFDLEGTTVTFSPNGEGEYAVTVGKLDWRDPGSEADTISGVQDWYRIPRTDVSYLW